MYQLGIHETIQLWANYLELIGMLGIICVQKNLKKQLPPKCKYKCIMYIIP